MPLKDLLKNQNIHFPTPPLRQDTFPLSHMSPYDSRSPVQAQLEQPLPPRSCPGDSPAAVTPEPGGVLQRLSGLTHREVRGGGVTGSSQLMSMDSEVGREAESFWMLSNSDAISGLALI